MATADEEYNYNPIPKVAKIAKNGDVGGYVDVPCPSSYQWAEEDVSESDAGRNEAGVMDKQMLGQTVKLEVSWQNEKTSVISSILQAFDSEYFMLIYLDAKTGEYETREFYVGNRTAPMYNSKLGLWSKLSFNLIERDCREPE